jgi:hypothetical protein
MGNESGKPKDCERGKHKDTFLCENTGCDQLICVKCMRKFGEMKLCIDCKVIIEHFAWGKERGEIKPLAELISDGASTQDQE